jgi:hypothetical protein
LSPTTSLLFADIRPIAGSGVFVLSPVDLVLHAMTHLFFDGDMADSLRDLVDIDLLIRHFAPREGEFWERFWRRAERLDLQRPAFYGLRYAHRLLRTPVPEPVLLTSLQGAPPAPVRRVMDVLVPRALFPRHPDCPDRWTAVCRLSLYVRSHWIRMPPLLLARHLGQKFYRRHIQSLIRRLRASASGAPAKPSKL